MIHYPSHTARALVPSFLRQKLLAGTVGEYHLYNLALIGLNHIQDEPEYLKARAGLYADMLLAAWEQRFACSVSSLLDLDRMVRVLGPGRRALLQRLKVSLPEGIELDLNLIERTDLPECMKKRLNGDYYRLQQDIGSAATFYEQSSLLPSFRKPCIVWRTFKSCLGTKRKQLLCFVSTSSFVHGPCMDFCVFTMSYSDGMFQVLP